MIKSLHYLRKTMCGRILHAASACLEKAYFLFSPIIRLEEPRDCCPAGKELFFITFLNGHMQKQYNHVIEGKVVLPTVPNSIPRRQFNPGLRKVVLHHGLKCYHGKHCCNGGPRHVYRITLAFHVKQFQA